MLSRRIINRITAIIVAIIMTASLVMPQTAKTTAKTTAKATNTNTNTNTTNSTQPLTLPLATPKTLTQEVNSELTYTPLSILRRIPQGYLKTGEDVDEDSDYIVSGGAVIANPYIEYEINQEDADALTIYPKDDITTRASAHYTHVNHVDVVAIAPIATKPATITIERVNHRYDPATKVTTTFNIYAQTAGVTEDVITILKDSSIKSLPVTTESNPQTTKEQYLLSDGRTGTFTYNGAISFYNQDTDKTDRLYYGARYMIESDNTNVVDPMAKSFTEDETAFDYLTKAPGTANITLKQQTATLSKQAQPKGGYTYDLFEEEPITIDKVRANVVESDIHLDNPSKLTLAVGEQTPLTVRATNRQTTAYTFRSSNTKVAQVSQTGVITAIKSGSAEITVSDQTATIKVKVTVKAATVKTSAKTVTMTVGTKTYKDIIKYRSPNATYTYKVANSKIATVSKTGAITALKKGTTKMKVYEKGKRLVGTVVLKVKSRINQDIDAAPELYKNQDTATITVIQNAKFDIKDYIVADDIETANLSYKANNNTVSITKNGLITANKEGTANVTVKSGASNTTIKINIISANESSDTDLKRKKAVEDLSKLAYLVNEDKYNAPTTFDELKSLTNQYIEAYNSANACDTEIIAGLDNYAPVPNASLLRRAKRVLDYTFKVMGASESLKVEPQSIDNDVVTLEDSISDLDILYYCYINMKEYTEESEIEYEGDCDETVFVKEYEAAASSYPYIAVVSKDGRTAYVGKIDDNPTNADGNPVTRHVKQTITLLYKESVTKEMAEGYEPSTIEKTYLIDTAHYGESIVDPTNNYNVVGNITPNSEIYIQDAVYEDFGTPAQKNYFTYDIVGLSEPVFTDTESYIYKLAGEERVTKVTAVGRGKTLTITPTPTTTPATITISGYQVLDL